MTKHASGRTPNRAERRAKRAREAEGIVIDDDMRAGVLRFIAENPERATKRDIARAFALKGEDRIALKHLLRELQDDGALEQTGKRLHEPGALPSVTVLDVVGRDGDGSLVGEPVEERLGTVAVRIIAARSAKERTPGVGDRILVRIGKDEHGPTARVMKVLKKRDRRTLGVFRTGERGARIEPVDRRNDEMVVLEGAENGAKDGDLVEVRMKASNRHGLAKAEVIEVLGSVSSEKAVSMIAIHALEIPHVFPERVLEEAANIEPLDARSMGDRVDWRHLPLLTIDPATAKDHDDAVMGEPDPDEEGNPGGMIATVAIADVAHYVRSGSALDREAMKRGNSVYFPDRVVPMLPERISNDLCSLRPEEDRPALAVRMVFAGDGTKRRHTFHRVLMRSPAKLAYEEAQAAIDGSPSANAADWVEPALKPLWKTYAVMLRGREKRQPLEIDVPERRIELSETGEVTGVSVPERLDAHRLIEEFMVQANVCAAETLEARTSPLLYRVHDAPSLSKMEALREFLASMEMSVVKGGSIRPHHFNSILAKVAETDQSDLVNQVVLRSQSQAEYNPANLGHFGLNLARYAHFTSPIRRFADLVVHRALIRALGLGEGGLGDDDAASLGSTAEHISMTERRAMQAERDTVSRLISAHLADKVGATFAARIGGVNKAGLFVTLRETGADGFVPVSSLGDEYFNYDEATHAMVGSSSGTGYQLGDPVEVRLIEAAPMAGALRFEMLSEGRKMPVQTRSAHKLAKGRTQRDRFQRRSTRGRR